MGLLNRIRIAQYPLDVLGAKVLSRAKYEFTYLSDKFFDTRQTSDVPLIKRSFVTAKSLDLSELDREAAAYILQKYFSHKYDLLGSGWIKNSYFVQCPGLEGYRYHQQFDFNIDREGNWLSHLLSDRHLQRSKEIINLLKDNYEPIDWQRDYKSGYRWSQKVWYDKQPIGHKPGIDVKVPWELSRMQHLVQLAIFAITFNEKRQNILIEYRNQIIDFIATNPPRMGVNWVCTMDVGIRAANMLLSYDILKQLDDSKILDPEFDKIFSTSIYEHGKHIICNLEYSTQFTTNHYLANISGLLFIAAYLDSNTETDFWLMFSFQELISEFKKQFYVDGVNFEASTSYHCLSSELIAYSTALILGIDDARKKKAFQRSYAAYFYEYPFLKKKSDQEFSLEDPTFFPAWYTDRLFRSGKFVQDITKPNGDIAQIGDNDSGKFFKFIPKGKFLNTDEAHRLYANLIPILDNDLSKVYWDENTLNHQDISSTIASLFEGRTKQTSLINKFEASFVRTLTSNREFRPVEIQNHNMQTRLAHNLPIGMIQRELVIQFEPLEKVALESLEYIVYEVSGYCIIKGANLFLIIPFGDVGQNGLGGHSHNDKLSFEFTLGEKNYAMDPGTYIYTALPDKRNFYRSTAAHNTMFTKVEQNEIDERDLFRLKNESECELLEISSTRALFSLRYKNIVQYRQFVLREDSLEIKDMSNADFTVTLNNFEFYSNGYGKLMNKNTL